MASIPDFPVPTPEAILEELFSFFSSGPRVREAVIIEGRTYWIDRPGQADRFGRVAAVRAAQVRYDYTSYWAELWPAARMLAKAILHETWMPGRLEPEALEIGCGLGLPGIVALTMGLQVTFSDVDACALCFAADNARLNGFETFRTLQLDWRTPPDGLCVPIILASDLTYEERHAAPIASFIKKTLAPGGVCLLTDENRIPARLLQDALKEADLCYQTKLMRAGEPGGRRSKGTLYRITSAT